MLLNYEKRLVDLGYSGSTRGAYLILARRLLEFADGRAIDAGMVDSFRDEVAPGMGSKRWGRYCSALNAFLAYLGLEHRVRPPPKVRSMPRCLIRPEEFEALLRTAFHNPVGWIARRDVALLMLLGDSAARPAELITLRIDDLDRGRGFARTRPCGNRMARTLYMGDATLEALAVYLRRRGPPRTADDGGFLFLTREGRRMGRAKSVDSIIKKAGRRAGITCLPTATMLRRMRITQLSELGLTPYQLMRFAGLSDLRELRAWVEVEDEGVRRALREMEPGGQAVGTEAAFRLASRLARSEISEDSFLRAIEALGALPGGSP